MTTTGSMPTAAEGAWRQLCQVVDGLLTEEDLILMSLADLRALMNDHGFTPLTAARAEVQWQVLQGTNRAARRRDYEDSVRTGSPQRSAMSATPCRAPSPDANGTFSPAPASEKPSRAPDTCRTVSPMRMHDSHSQPVDRSSRSGTPTRRKLGSREGVASPKSLRPPRAFSPSSKSYSPLVHAAPFEVPKVVLGPHLSRRTPLSPSRREPPPQSIHSPRSCHPPPATANPNEMWGVTSPVAQSAPAGGMRTFPNASASHSDPNSIANDTVPHTSIRLTPASNSATFDVHRTSQKGDPEPKRPTPVPQVRRAPAGGNPNDIKPGTPRSDSGKRITQHCAPAPSDPNTHATASQQVVVPRKMRVPHKDETTEDIKTFTATQGPPEGGVMPGTQAWIRAQRSAETHGSPARERGRAVISVKQADPHMISGVGPEGADVVSKVKWIGGKSSICRPADVQVAEALCSPLGDGKRLPSATLFFDAAGLAPPGNSPRAAHMRLKGASPQRTREPPTPSNPNTLTDGADTVQYSRLGGSAPTDDWGGVGARDEAAGGRKSGLRSVAPLAHDPELSHALYSTKKADHLVQQPRHYFGSPRLKRDYSPRYVPSAM